MDEKLLGLNGIGLIEQRPVATPAQIREDATKLLRVEVVADFPAHADGKVIYHTGNKKFYGSADGEWL